MDKKEAAQYLNVSTRTLERYVQEKGLKVVYLGKKAIFDDEQIAQLKEELSMPVHKALVVSPSTPEGVQEQETELGIEQVYHNYQQAGAIAYLRFKMLLNLEEASLVSGISKSGLRKAAKAGAIAAVKYRGRWNFRYQDLNNFIDDLFNPGGA